MKALLFVLIVVFAIGAAIWIVENAKTPDKEDDDDLKIDDMINMN
jgi:hypothetical protein